MKKLTRIKLINWHLFSNVTIDIKDNTLITGENATGKTTLLDAIQFLLVGGKGGSKFNIAANTDGKRTVENYIKGKTGDVGNEYIRTGDVVTHICIEYYDQYAKDYSIIGCILELPRSGKLNDRFYFIESIKISDDLFIDGNLPRNYNAMKTYFKNTLNREFRVFETTKAYREQISKFFNIDANKYAKLLPKALAFKPINLQTFVNDFLLDVDEVDINSIKNNFENLKKIEDKIQIDEEKLIILNKISENALKCQEQQTQIKVNNLLTKINYIENQEEFLKTTSLEISNIVTKNNNYNLKKIEHDLALNNKDLEILNLEKSKESNDFSKTISNLNDHISKKEQELERAQVAHNELIQNIESELMIYNELGKVVKNNRHISDFVEYLQKNSSTISYNIGTLNALLTNLANEKSGLENKYRYQRDT
ncbi:MAG: AAA family ATPase, partial [Acholeplasmatales bacterium]|nr:AAA family ATPase [Acholeplasmatales bacterium]